MKDEKKRMEIRDAAAKYLAHRSRTVKEMKRHLLGKGFRDCEELVEAVAAEFLACGYLDDEAYCRQYFDYAFGKGKGKRLVFAELKEKGVDEELIRFAFEDWQAEEANGYDEKESAMEEARKVLLLADVDLDAGPIDERVAARIGRRLRTKGYGMDVISKVIGELRR